MSKHHRGYSVQKLLLAFFTSICQCILFAPIFIVYVVFIPWPPIVWIWIASPFLFSVLSAYGLCFLMHRDNFHFNPQNIVSKSSVYRLSVRFLSVFCFLLIGYVADKKPGIPIYVSDILRNFGEHADTFESLLGIFTFYLFVAIFPIVFALVEYLFVSVSNHD